MVGAGVGVGSFVADGSSWGMGLQTLARYQALGHIGLTGGTRAEPL